MASNDHQSDNFLNFIIIGAPKSGTSWAATCLKEHPQTCFPPVLGYGIFSEYTIYKKGDTFFGKSINWYKKQFSKYSPGTIRGESSPNYLQDPDAAKLLSENLPNTKLIAILRNPIKRFVSQHAHAKKMCAKKHLPPPPFLSSEKFLKSHELFDLYIKPGLYYENLRYYLNLFPPRNVFISIYEDIPKDESLFMKKIYRFLGINEDFKSSNLYKKINSKKEKTDWLSSVPFLKKPKETLSNNMRKHLQRIYKKDISNLERMIGRDLSFWN